MRVSVRTGQCPLPLFLPVKINPPRRTAKTMLAITVKAKAPRLSLAIIPLGRGRRGAGNAQRKLIGRLWPKLRSRMFVRLWPGQDGFGRGLRVSVMLGLYCNTPYFSRVLPKLANIVTRQCRNAFCYQPIFVQPAREAEVAPPVTIDFLSVLCVRLRIPTSYPYLRFKTKPDFRA